MTTPKMGAAELAPAQAIPEATLNDIVLLLEQGIGHFTIVDRDLATPPGSPASGAAYIVAPSPTGAWTGHAGDIVFWQVGSGWRFIEILEGWTFWIADENVHLLWDGAALVPVSGGSSYTDEEARDAIGAALVAGSNVSITVNDAGDVIEISAGISASDVSLYEKHQILIIPNPGVATVTTIGCTVSIPGLAARNYATTNALTKRRRAALMVTNTANGYGAMSPATANFPRELGFTFKQRFCVEQAQTDGRLLVGLWAAGYNGSNDPSNATNAFFVGTDSGDTNLQIMHNDNAGTCTKIDLGASFPGKTSSADFYEVTLDCDPGASTMTYTVTNLTTSTTVTGSVTTNLPTNTTALLPWIGSGTGATATAHTTCAISPLYCTTKAAY